MSQTQKSASIAAALGLMTVTAIVYGQASRIPVTVNETKSAPPPTKLTMESKLTQSQRVMEGLVRRDFEAIEDAANVLKQISLSPPPSLKKAGDDSDEAVYEHFRMEFARLAGKLEGHARRKEPEATAYVHQNLTATCIACHDYIRDYP